MRDHKPVKIDAFNGLYQRGDVEEVPRDHFSDCENLKFIGTSSCGSRDGLDIHQDVLTPLGRIRRIYNYVTQDANTLLVLRTNGADGEIYHVVDSTTVYGPILTIAGMTDFGFVAVAGRAYITPFTTYVFGDLNIEKGLEDEFVYVYLGDGAAARKAAGAAPTGNVTVANGAAGHTDVGKKLFGVVYERDTGHLSSPSAFFEFDTAAAFSVSFTTVPVSLDTSVVKRHIVSTITLVDAFNGNFEGYEYFFIPNGTINDNILTTLADVSFYDADLLEDASYLFDNYTEIPAGVGLALYHDRLCVFTTFTDISLILVSAPGEPEAISQIDGLIVFPLDGNPITNAKELKDIFYVMKRNRTGAYIDNGEAPSTWPFTMIDQALGAPVHGIATVIDSGAATVDFLIVTTFAGIVIFNGLYQKPELTWKIRDYWLDLDRDEFRKIQIINDPIGQLLLCALPDGRLLIGDYNNGMTPKDIRWMPDRFDISVDTVALVNINQIIIGSIGGFML